LRAEPCVNPSSTADSDGDGVPDDATYLFTAPPCRFEGWRGGTLDIVGSLRIQDPAATNAGFGYDGTLTNLRTLFISADGKTLQDVRRNGTRTLSDVPRRTAFGQSFATSVSSVASSVL